MPAHSPWIVSLGQSACNQHAYDVWLYHTPHVLCSNHFPMTEKEGATAEEADWLSKNIMPATLPPMQKWYFE